jgi:trk system potassium uptake protein
VVIPAHDVSPPTHRRGALDHPARLVSVVFLAGVLVGTTLLSLPVSTSAAGRASLGDAAFTATSAITVTGLAINDTAATWSAFGEWVILLLIQVGGFGIMSLASLVLLGFSHRLRLRHRMVAQVETGVLTLGEVRGVLRQVLTLSLVVEAAVAVVLTARFWFGYGEDPLRAVWLGLFHAVSAFNNAGFGLRPDSLVQYNEDPIILLTVAVTIILGGLGVPVVVELRRSPWRWSTWSLHTRLVVVTTAILIVGPWLFICAVEWTNPATLGGLGSEHKLLNALFQSITCRTAGFNSVDIAGLNETTRTVMSALMFVGAAPVSTGGGIKVTTFALLAFVILSEIRGDRDVVVFDRRAPAEAQRQALAIALIGVGAVGVGTLILLALGDWGLGPALFEVTSALGTVGLSTGITPLIPGTGRILLGVLMFAGRVGPLTLGAALAGRRREARFRYPQERPLVG